MYKTLYKNKNKSELMKTVIIPNKTFSNTCKMLLISYNIQFHKLSPSSALQGACRTSKRASFLQEELVAGGSVVPLRLQRGIHTCWWRWHRVHCRRWKGVPRVQQPPSPLRPLVQSLLELISLLQKIFKRNLFFINKHNV